MGSDCKQCANCKHNGCKSEPKEDVSRRRLLGWLVGTINVGVVAAVVTPTLGFIAAPLRRKKAAGNWIPVLDAADLKDGQTTSVTYKVEVDDGYMKSEREYSAFVYRKGSKILAFDPSCPHLGCNVEFKDRKNRYVCPCHGGVFDVDGERVSGPPPRGLTKIASREEDGRIWLYRG
jgi:menaquinol-cytochrome c reductase iron-sulfur subunit